MLSYNSLKQLRSSLKLYGSKCNEGEGTASLTEVCRKETTITAQNTPTQEKEQKLKKVLGAEKCTKKLSQYDRLVVSGGNLDTFSLILA